MKQEEVNDLIGSFLNVYPQAEFGPGHIALSDGNLNDSSLDFCLAQEKRRTDPNDGDTDEGEDEAVRHFLRLLKAIPEWMRE